EDHAAPGAATTATIREAAAEHSDRRCPLRPEPTTARDDGSSHENHAAAVAARRLRGVVALTAAPTTAKRQERLGRVTQDDAPEPADLPCSIAAPRRAAVTTDRHVPTATRTSVQTDARTASSRNVSSPTLARTDGSLPLLPGRDVRNCDIER